tara:strand:- start:40734 stop:41447 length:714 start_codon:yes stop_codon:yes gene_type:complete
MLLKNIMNTRLLLFIFSMMFISCAGVKKNIVAPETYTKLLPELNKIKTSEIGSFVVYKENGYQNDAIEIVKTFSIKPDGVLKVIEKGQIFIHKYNTNDYDFYGSASNSEFGVAIPINGENPLIYFKSIIDGIYSTGTNYNELTLIKPKEQIDYIHIKVRTKHKDYFKKEFIYNGRVGNALKFIYREYINDYARPAFTQEVQYDLSENKIIGFRGMRIEIIKATNTTIEYKVLNYFEK